MEVELEPRVKPLPFKVKAISRESPSQKASHVLDTDLRNHWSTGTNTKEWILLELDEPCLLSHVRMYNKSVLEWEISVGLRYKPETFLKVRPRCEAPRRDIVYPMNYSPCRFVRISCLRGNPIAIFFIQLIGISIPGLEPEFQPIVNYLLPHIMSHKQDAHDMHLQLLQGMTSRLVTFLPQLEVDLNGFSEAAEPTLRFLAMLVGPFYPILRVVNEREAAKVAGNVSDYEASKNSQVSVAFTVSSNFEPRRLRSASASTLPSSSYLVFRPDAIFMLLRLAYKDQNLGKVCAMASQILLKLTDPAEQEGPSAASDIASDEASKSETHGPLSFVDYSTLFGEEIIPPDCNPEPNYLNILDIATVEEGLLHLLYACASQPRLCSKLADSISDFWLALPLVQALLPALRPIVNGPDQIDDSFSQWKQPFVQRALSEVVAMSSSSVYRPLLRACAGYLASFSPSHAKAACVLIDLCSCVLAPWMAQVVAKIDLAVELVEDLFTELQGAQVLFARARAALKYLVLALSGKVDDIMAKYKDVKHQILFLVEMLEPFLDPAMTPVKSVISFGNVSSTFLEKQEHNCAIALNVIRAATRKPAVLPSLEAEWRRGSVAPSVLLSILEPHMQLPVGIDLRKFPVSESPETQSLTVSSYASVSQNGGASAKSNSQDDSDGRTDNFDITGKMDITEELNALFAPSELASLSLTNASCSVDLKQSDSDSCNVNMEGNNIPKDSNKQSQDNVLPNNIFVVEYSNLQADYLQLINYRDCELRASEFRRFALDLQSQSPLAPEGHNTAIDALLLAAECYINPYFMMPFRNTSQDINKGNVNRNSESYGLTDVRRVLEKKDTELKIVDGLERKRDKAVLELLLEAAELDRKYQKTALDAEIDTSHIEEREEVISLAPDGILFADAITLVRQNQALLCNFLIQRLQRNEQSVHEILMQCVLFVLHSATKLFCAPESIVDIILNFAEFFNGLLKSIYYQFKEGNLQLDQSKLHEVQRRWVLLRRLVIASSGTDEESSTSISVQNGFRLANLIPPSAWLQKVSVFSCSASPLVRYLGWMAVSRNAKQYLKDRLFLGSDLSQLTYLISIFSDELSLVDNIVDQKNDKQKTEESRVRDTGNEQVLGHSSQEYVDLSFHAIYPEISQFFPDLKKEFEAFGESILEAVRLQLRSLSSAVVPDLMCWFSDLCSWPFLGQEQGQLYSKKNPDNLKGFVAKNSKAVILFVLESILSEHMEAIVPELPRLVQVLASLCRSYYCDVTFLDSILHLLKPIIAHSLHKVSKEEIQLSDDSCSNFESLCFDELLDDIRQNNNDQGHQKIYSRALTIFVLATVFPDLSFHCKMTILKSSLCWADFASSELKTSFHDYLCSYQTLMESCKNFLVGTSRVLGIIPFKTSLYCDGRVCESLDDSSESCSWFLGDVCNLASSTEVPENLEKEKDTAVHINEKDCKLTSEEIVEFSEELECLINKLFPTLDECCKIHRKLAKRLAITSAECFVYSKCLSMFRQRLLVPSQIDKEGIMPTSAEYVSMDCWNVSLQEYAQMILVLQEKHCWEVASVMLDCLLGVPECFSLDGVIDKLCSAIISFSSRAPNIAWRLQTDKWLSFLLRRGTHLLPNCETPINDVFASMLKHPEPEQRFIALKHLRKLMGEDANGGAASLSLKPTGGVAYSDLVISPVPILSSLVAGMWDQVACLVSSDTSLLLRTHAMALLLNCIPFAGRQKLQSFLAAADQALPSLANLTRSTCQGPVSKFSLALLANCCLHSPAEDISLIPEIVWQNIESIGVLENESCPLSLERRACQALCRLRAEGDEAKQMLQEVLSSASPEQLDPDFRSTRESILQVMSNFTSVQSYFDFFHKEMDKKCLEFEEAEIEMELLQKEHASPESANDIKDWHRLPFLADCAKDDNRLQQIKNHIRSLEKTKLREEIIARRQRKLLLKRARQKYIEEAALREAELLQELDRERTSEAERDVERQQLLELERAKTRELQHNLDMEREKNTQRELQRELEQVESGNRPSRREFPSSTHSRPRYRERENGRAVGEGNLRGSTGSMQSETATTSSSMATMPKVVLSGGRQFSGQIPTILQSQDRPDDYSSTYEENFDGSKDSGDSGSIGDPDLVSALEGQSIVSGSSLRHGSRGGKPRQIMERRERESRREGKWERKH
ncbi:uncharacterized protein [Coffea arabica]|uniref:Uncharacterized protein isoform X2 n=1 Tax=Coffea arabica TaxID=13443 RepID=A0A6P6TZU0_COFAR|nr:uncharacterized protein LOC113706289 isoform X2 [Coffea arabica]